MNSKPFLATMALITVLAACCGQACGSSSLTNHIAATASDSIVPFVALGELSLYMDHSQGNREAIQGAEAMAATGFLTEALKDIVREKRPNGTTLDSFPSGHTSAAFAVATAWGEYHPRYQWLGYTAASVIGWSRVELGEHRWTDVAAGALLGHFTAKSFVRKHVALTPNGVAFQNKF